MAAILASIFGSFWVALGLTILLADIRAFRRAGPLRRKRTAVGALEDGVPAKLVGTVRLPEERLRAPLSGRACAGYQVATARRAVLRWRALGVETRATGFYLDDGTGEVFVPLPAGARLQLGVNARALKRKRGRMPQKLRAVLAPYFEPCPPAASYRCDERALLDGMRVAVYGTFHAQPDARPATARSYRGRTYCFVADAEAPEGIHVSDDRATLG